MRCSNRRSDIARCHRNLAQSRTKNRHRHHRWKVHVRSAHCATILLGTLTAALRIRVGIIVKRIHLLFAKTWSLPNFPEILTRSDTPHSRTLTALRATCSEAGSRKPRHRREMGRLSNFFWQTLFCGRPAEKTVRGGKTRLFIAGTKGVLSRHTRPTTIYVYPAKGNSSGSVGHVDKNIRIYLPPSLSVIIYPFAIR